VSIYSNINVKIYKKLIHEASLGSREAAQKLIDGEWYPSMSIEAVIDSARRVAENWDQL